MRAKELRARARTALRGRVGVSLGVCLVGSLVAGGLDFLSVFLDQGAYGQQSYGLQAMPGGVQMLPTMLITLVLSLVVTLALEGIMVIGMCHYFTNLAARRRSGFGDLFSGFRIFGKAVCMNLVMAGLIMLWTMAGVIPVTAAAVWWTMGRTVTIVETVIVIALIVLASIPGIIAGYRYAMVPYIIAEFTDIPVMDAVRESKRLMKGNKGRFFCLQLSFIGWALLNILTLGIGSLWLAPYMQAANAAFYMDVTGRSDL